MAKRVYFAFHYQDVIDLRANVVRNHWVTKPDRELAGFFDASIWENAKKTSVIAVKRLINNEIKNTSVTCVLIGSETYARRWVRYEIFKSLQKGNRVFGAHINSIRGKDKRTKRLRPNPFDFLGCKFSDNGDRLYLYEAKGRIFDPYGDLDTCILEHRASQKDWGKFYKLSSYYSTFDWINDDGYNNFVNWVG